MALTATDAARRTGVSQALILAEIKGGHLAAVRRGGHAWAIEEAELARWQATPRTPVGRPLGGVSITLDADMRSQLRTLALAAEVSIETKAAILFEAALATEWRTYAGEIVGASPEWEGEIL